MTKRKNFEFIGDRHRSRHVDCRKGQIGEATVREDFQKAENM